MNDNRTDSERNKQLLTPMMRHQHQIFAYIYSLVPRRSEADDVLQDSLYIALNGTSVVYHDEASATQMTGWNQWVIDLQAFAGVDLANVNTIAIGIGTKDSPAAGGAGTMYFDDMRLIR